MCGCWCAVADCVSGICVRLIRGKVIYAKLGGNVGGVCGEWVHKTIFAREMRLSKQLTTAWPRRWHSTCVFSCNWMGWELWKSFLRLSIGFRGKEGLYIFNDGGRSLFAVLSFSCLCKAISGEMIIICYSKFNVRQILILIYNKLCFKIRPNSSLNVKLSTIVQITSQMHFCEKKTNKLYCTIVPCYFLKKKVNVKN